MTTFLDLIHKAKDKRTIQTLWSGYGNISRYYLDGDIPSVIVKEINLSKRKNHPRGWNSDLSHERKLKSYQVELAWYKDFANNLSKQLRLPNCYYYEIKSNRIILILEDLDAIGFNLRHQSLNLDQLKLCLDWLAKLHAKFMGQNLGQLWKTGTYWHLETRTEEWSRMDAGWLKSNATKIDKLLNSTQFHTIVHGDAKVANFCFKTNDSEVAAVDFQYIGRGCGMKDVAYLMSSCLNSDECYEFENQILGHYFEKLTKYSGSKDINALESEWRRLFCVAWADFARFLMGWAPDHYKLHSYCQSKVDESKLII